MNRLILSAGAHLTVWEDNLEVKWNAATIAVSVQKEDGTPVRGDSEFTVSLLTVDPGGGLPNPPILRPLTIEYLAPSLVGDGHFFLLVVIDTDPNQGALSFQPGKPAVLAINLDEFTIVRSGAEPIGDFHKVLVARGNCVVNCTQVEEIQRPLESKGPWHG